MTQSSFITMIDHLSQSLPSVIALITGFGYLIGISLIISALGKLKKIGHTVGHSSHEKMFIPIAYLVGGAALIFFPSAVHVMSNTLFGQGNPLQYSSYGENKLFASMKLLIETAGVIWFFRGIILIVHATEPGVKDGTKGLLFLIAGIFAINFEYTVGMLTTVMKYLISMT